MKPDLLGYVLQTLEPEEERSVEEYLESTPEARRELLRLRPLLNALDAQEEPAPSKDLIFKTLRAIASQRTHEEHPKSDVTPAPIRRSSTKLPQLEPWKSDEYESGPTNWRRADAWALIAVVMLILLAIPPVLQYVRDRAVQVECKDNLRQYYGSFARYAENHGGAIPALSSSGGATSRAGIYASVLRDEGLWGERMRLGCPPGSASMPQPMEEVKKHGDDEFAYWQKFAGSYAYHLGYQQNENGNINVKPVKRGDGDNIAILADRPARFGEVPDWTTANSPNHGGNGQNVLFMGGHVQFFKTRSIAQGDDRDMYRNVNNQQAAGLHPHDVVLGPSEARPLGSSAIPID